MSGRPCGWVKVYRQMADQEDWLWNERRKGKLRPRTKWEARCDLLLMHARWKDGPYESDHGSDYLTRGEFVASTRFLGERWGWSHNKASNFLKKLDENGFIRWQRKGRHGDVYLVANYDRYQGDDPETVTAEVTEEGQSSDKREEGKKGKTLNAPKVTWLSPYLEAWRAQYGTNLSVEKSSRPLRNTEKELGAEECLARFRRYLVGTKVVHASAARFAETHTAYTGSLVQHGAASPARSESDWMKKNGYGIGA